MVRCFYNSYDMCIHLGNYLDNTQVYHVIYIYIHTYVYKYAYYRRVCLVFDENMVAISFL